jgi:D-alanine-D-alanine ligase
MDDKGRIYFIECNPLPGLTPGWSDLVLIAQGAGMDYRTLIGEIMAPAIRRYKEREARRAADEHNFVKAVEEKPSNGTAHGAQASGEPSQRLDVKA